MNNLKIWSTSNISIIKLPKIKKLPKRSSKIRKKTIKSIKTKSDYKHGLVMTYSKCHIKEHYKKECPTKDYVGPSKSIKIFSHLQIFVFVVIQYKFI